VLAQVEAEAASAFGANTGGGPAGLSDAEAALLTSGDTAGGERWRHLSAFVPAAVGLLLRRHHACSGNTEGGAAGINTKGGADGAAGNTEGGLDASQAVPPTVSSLVPPAPVSSSAGNTEGELAASQAALSASCLHFLASYVQGLPRQVNAAAAALPLLPW